MYIIEFINKETSEQTSVINIEKEVCILCGEKYKDSSKHEWYRILKEKWEGPHTLSKLIKKHSKKETDFLYVMYSHLEKNYNLNASSIRGCC